MFFFGLVLSTALYAAVTSTVLAFLGRVGAPVAVVLAVIYVALLLLDLVIIRLSTRGRGNHLYRAPGVLDLVVAQITNPFRGLIAFRGASRVIDGSRGRRTYSWATVTLHFVWAVLLLAVVVLVLTLALV